MTEENLTPYIPIGTLFKYLLKDYRRERQRTIHMEAQVRSLLKRNAYLEQEIGKVKQRLLKKVEKSEKQIDYSQEISRLHQGFQPAHTPPPPPGFFPAGTTRWSSSGMRMPD